MAASVAPCRCIDKLSDGTDNSCVKIAKSYLCTILFLSLLFSPCAAGLASRQHVYVSGTVQSFGSYHFTPALSFAIQEPGLQEIGTILVEGMYNGEYPWIMRIYTENAHFAGVAGGIRPATPAGLVSRDGQYVIPIEIKSPTFDDVWRRVPDLFETPYIPYAPSDDPTAPPEYTDCLIMGIDPRHAPWVAGPDGQLFTDDDNPLGDLTMATPFQMSLRARVDPRAVQGPYDALIYIEIVPAP